MENKSSPHNSVMLAEVLKFLAPKSDANKIYIDATFGAGGYSDAILLSAQKNKLFSFDRDPDVVKYAENINAKYNGRVELIRNNFGNLTAELAQKGVQAIDGIVFDLGVSSMQLDEAVRGFSFNKEAKLDMRMSQQGNSAYEVVNEMPEAELADIIYKYGDEKKSRHIFLGHFVGHNFSFFLVHYFHYFGS